MPDDTIITMRYTPNDDEKESAIVESGTEIRDLGEEQKLFKVRLADTEKGRSSVSMLINERYAWRGYAGSHDIQIHPNRITLAASDQTKVIGTITISIDSSIGILADEIFKDQIDIQRSQGGKVCEFIKLAFDPDIRSKRVMAAIFHIAFIYIRHLQKCSDLFIEVSPRHRRFYERMLGFKQQGDIKTNTRVNSPAFLLRLDLEYAHEQIRLLAGSRNQTGSERSLYSYFYSKREEEGIANRLFMLG